MSKNVQLVKLVTGELMVAEVADNGDGLTLTKGLQVAMVPDQQGQTQMVFVDFNGSLSDDEQLTVAKDSVVYSLTARADVAASYEERINPSSIITPPTPELDLSNVGG